MGDSRNEFLRDEYVDKAGRQIVAEGFCELWMPSELLIKSDIEYLSWRRELRSASIAAVDAMAGCRTACDDRTGV